MESSRRDFLKTSCLALGFISLVGFTSRAFAKPRRTNPDWDGITTSCVITCPSCKTKVKAAMGSENLKRVYHCPACLVWLSPKKGDHCIYDSYGSVKCPAMQLKARKAQNLPI
jgi:hypothetical protein